MTTTSRRALACLVTAFACVAPPGLAAGDGDHAGCGHHAPAAAGDADAARRADLDARGDRHMGFRQEATTHHFRVSETGGAIEVTARDAADAATVAQVRDHLRHIAGAFAGGDFAIPEAVHAEVPAGVPALRAAGAAVSYEYEELPAGARVVLTGAGAEAIAAVHEFLGYQIEDHGTGDPHPAGGHHHP